MSFAIEVLEPGFLTTVQDLGRPGFAASGVSASGAADPVALRVANRWVGNEPGAAALEMTLVGGRFRFERETIVAVGGSASAEIGGRPVSPWSALPVTPGGVLTCGPLRDGARAYLAVRGGFDVPRILGSASTHLVTALGGLHGRALRAGDRVPLGDRAPHPTAREPLDPRRIPGYLADGPIRIVDGPQAEWFSDAARASLTAVELTVTEACDRMGLRLAGADLRPADARELVTEGVALGAIQVTPDGTPIVLFVEHQTTGGYPKIANVIAADLARLGRLRPRDRIRFERISLEEARRALRAREEALSELLA